METIKILWFNAYKKGKIVNTMISKISSVIFIIFLLLFGLSFFYKDNYKSVGDFEPRSLNEAVQTSPKDKEPLYFDSNIPEITGPQIKFRPIYDFEVSGLVVKKEKTAITLFWGKTLEDGLYQNIKLGDKRVTYPTGTSVEKYYSYLRRFIFHTDSKEVEDSVNDLKPGDQVTLKGQIIYDKDTEIKQDNLCWNFYIKEVNILKKGGRFWDYLYKISGIGIVAVVIFKIFWFFITTISKRNQTSI